jgi:hypothetical protein
MSKTKEKSILVTPVPFVTKVITADKVKMAPADITLTLTPPSIATYKLFGFATISLDETMLTLKTDDGEEVMTVPIDRVNSLIIEW